MANTHPEGSFQSSLKPNNLMTESNIQPQDSSYLLDHLLPVVIYDLREDETDPNNDGTSDGTPTNREIQ